MRSFPATLIDLPRPAALVAEGPLAIPPSVLATLAAALLLLMIIALIVARLSRPKAPRSPYRRKASLFTRDERRFYDALQQAAGDRFIVFAQMRLVDLMEAPRGAEGSAYWYAKIRNKHVDFVLCDPETTSPVLAIELDGTSHQSEIQQQRDAEKDASLAQAGIPLVRVATQKQGYAPARLAAVIDDALR